MTKDQKIIRPKVGVLELAKQLTFPRFGGHGLRPTRPRRVRERVPGLMRSMESFFHTLKVELVHRERFATREEARRELFVYLEGYDNRQRLHSALGYRTPEQAEQLAA